MKQKLLTFASLGLGLVAVVLARPPQQEGGAGGPPRGPAGEHGPPPLPLVEVLDADHDQQLSAEEIANAAEALKKLDHDGDGQLSPEEFLPPPPPPPPSARERRGPRGEGQARVGERGPGLQPRGPEFRGTREGRPGNRSADRFGPPPEDRAGDGPRVGAPPRGPGRGPQGPGFTGPDGGPDHARFVEHVFEFDADGDGLISRDELKKFAEQMPGPGGPGRRGPGTERQEGAQPRVKSPADRPPGDERSGGE